MRSLPQVFENNALWIGARTAQDPQFFSRLANQQAPEYLWIGCADSRVPTHEIIGLCPGDAFSHRNIANVVGPADVNCLSLLL